MKRFHFAIEDIGLDVCHTVGSKHTDGRGVVALSIAKTLLNRGHLVDLLVQPGRRIDSRWGSEIVLHHVKSYDFPDRSQTGKWFDLLIANHWSIGKRLCTTTPIVYAPHEFEFLRGERCGYVNDKAILAQESLMERSSGILVPSRSIFEILLERQLGDSEKLYLSPFGVDTEIFKLRNRENARDKLGLSRDVPLILYVGALEVRKGISTLMDAFDRLEFDVQLCIVGEPRSDSSAQDEALFRELKEWMKLTPASKPVLYQGAQPWLNLPLYYSAADVVVLPSIMEPFGLPTIEALACGACIAGSNIDGFKELIRPGIDGLLSKPGDAIEFAFSIRKILSDLKWHSVAARQARRDHAKTFMWDRVAITIEAVVESVLSSKYAEVSTKL